MDKPPIQRLVWWKYPPKPGDTENDIEWCYIEIDEKGFTRFIDERPSDEEIRTRSSCALNDRLHQ